MISSDRRPRLRPSDGSRSSRWAGVVGLLVALGIAVGGLVPVSAGTASSATHTSAALSAAGPSVTCNSVVTPTPSALLVQVKEPSRNLSVGGSIGYEMELAIVNYTNGSAPVNLTFPTVFFDFPLATGGNYSLTLAAGNVTLNRSGWTAPTFLARTNVVTRALNFTPGGLARMDSMKVAVMSSAAYGAVDLEVRWRWLETEPGANVTYQSGWNIPTPKANWPTDVPSEFYPAAYVRLVGTSSSPVFIGNNYTMTIGGPYIAGQWFFQELEHPSSGHVVEGYAVTVPTGVSTYGIGVPALGYGHFLVPGTYLAHLHDECGALLYSRTIVAKFAPSVNITFYIPAGCGSVVFGGVHYANNTTGHFVPSANLTNLTPHGCRGKKFIGTTLTGALHAYARTRVRISGSGTLTMNFA